MILRIVLLFCVLVFCDAAFEGDRCSLRGVEGICTLLYKCRSALDDLKKRRPPSPDCGFRDRTPIVCCRDNPGTDVTTTTHRPMWMVTTPRIITTTPLYIPPEPVYHDERNEGQCSDLGASMTSAKTGQKAFDKCIEYQERFIYPCEKSVALSAGFNRGNNCHHNADQLIIGGNDTHAHEFPHMVLLGYGENEQSIQWLCGGSIISERFILTAAHCNASSRPDDAVKYILAGALTRSDADDPSKIYKVKTIIMHPEHQAPSKYNDLMLLLTEKIALSQYVVPACLHLGDPVDDERVLATGWGLLGPKSSLSEVMQKVILHKFTTEECSEQYEEHRLLARGFDPQIMTCYGHRTKMMDTCKGDSGGPIQIKSKRIHCMYVIVGVTSFGRKCGLPAEAAIYTRVAHYLPWIESIVWP